MASPPEHNNPVGTDVAIPVAVIAPPSKRRRLDSDPPTQLTEPMEQRFTDPRATMFPPLKDWPDDIVIHLLQFLDYDSLINFHTTCKRTHFFIRHNLKHLLDPFIASIPYTLEIQQLLTSRSYFTPQPPRYSFAYINHLRQLHSDFELIAVKTNPVRSCPRTKIHPDIDFTTFLASHIDFFRTSYCHYFSDPVPHVTHFWTLFWEYKRIKAVDPDYLDTVAEWAWKRYSYQEILGVARFNGSYYSRIITSSLNCQRDALRMVLEIYSTRDSKSEMWSVTNGIPALQWSRSLSRESKSEYRTGQIPPGIERFHVTIPITVSVSAKITPTESTSDHTFKSELSGLDLVLYRLADFESVYNATIDKTWEERNMIKTIEFQDFFDFVWGSRMAERAAECMSWEMSSFLDAVV